MTPPLVRVLVVSLAGLSVGTGCVRRPSKFEEPTPAADAIAASRPFLAPLELTDDPLEDAIVRVVGAVSCTGTLVADDLVLTAHHCVASRDERGRVLEQDEPASSLRVELGGDDLPWGEVGVRAIVTPACGYVKGDGDVALLVLDRKLVGMPVLAPRLEESPTAGEAVMPWGFGRCAAERGAIRRHDREGGRVDAVEAGVFRATASVCPGDSGGPVVDHARRVIGVVSASVMDADPATRGTSYFARIDRFHQLFSAAREIAAGASPAELPPYRSCGADALPPGG